MASTAESSQRAPTPRPSMVGRPPLVSSRKPCKRPATGAAPSTTPRRTAPPPRPHPVPSVPLMRGLNAVPSSLATSGILPAQGFTPLAHSSQLPLGFSLSGTAPLVVPTSTGIDLKRLNRQSNLLCRWCHIQTIYDVIDGINAQWN